MTDVMLSKLIPPKKIDDILFILFYSLGPFMGMIVSILGTNVLPNGGIAVIKIVLITLLIFRTKKKVNMYSFLLIMLLTTAFAVSALEVSNREYIIEIIFTIEYLFGFAVFIFFSKISNPARVLNNLKSISYLIISFNIIKLFNDGYDISQDYMQFGYSTVLFLVILLGFVFKDKKLIDTLFTIISGFIIISFSNRGVILVLIIAFLVFLTVYMKGKARFFLVSILTLLGLIIYVNYIKVLGLIEQILINIGIHSRNFSALQNETFLESNSRIVLWENLIELISENPLIGSGIGADRVYNGGSGHYAHNIFLELLVNYGVILGTLLFICILSLGIYMILICKDIEWKNLFIPFYVTSFITLMISHSVYTEENFGISLAIFFSYISWKKNKKSDVTYTANT